MFDFHLTIRMVYFCLITYHLFYRINIIMSKICEKCVNLKLSYLKVHDCLHECPCLVKESLNAPPPRTNTWVPSNCFQCKLWVAKLNDDTLTSADKSNFASMMRDIRRRRAKSRVPEERQWNFFPDTDLASKVAAFLATHAAGW